MPNDRSRPRTGFQHGLQPLILEVGPWGTTGSSNQIEGPPLPVR